MRRRQGILSRDLRWPRPSKAAAARAVAATEGMARFIAASGGLPRAIKPKSVKDEAIQLLRVAAEIEHALMVEYLYAALTLAPGADPKYRRTLVTIAKQEMGHLVTVQNLLRLLGAPPHLDRDDLLPSSGKEPATFALERVTPESLAKYTVIESPLDEMITGESKAIYERARAKIDTKSMQRLNRVGALYVVLYWLFMEKDEPEADEPWRLNPDDVLLQNPTLKGVHLRAKDFVDAEQVSPFMTVPDDWRVAISTIFVDETIDRASAKLALFRIASQGEGVGDDPDGVSHFKRFLELFDAADKNPPATIDIVPERSKSAGNEIERRLIEFFNTRYQILLLLIDLSLRVPRDDPSLLRPAFSNLAVDEMVQGIKSIGKAMLGLTGDNGPVAPSFALPDGNWPEDSLPSIGAGVKQLKRLLAQAKELDQELRAKAPGLIEGELDVLQSLNASIEESIGKLAGA